MDYGLTAERILRGVFRDLGSPAVASDWARQNFNIPAELSSTPGAWLPIEYQRVFLDMACLAGNPRKIVVLKSARIGYSLTLLAALCFLTVRARRHIICYLPKDEDAKLFSKGSVDPTLKACEPAAALLEAIDDKRRNDTMNYRSIGGRTIRILGSNVGNRFRSYTADAVFLDELDAYQANVGGEGSPVSLSATRTTNSPFRKQVCGGSPTHEDTSLTWREWTDCDLQLEFAVPCPHCGGYEPLEWENFHWDEADGTGRDNEKRANSVKHGCPSCGALWDWGKLRKALAEGRWQAKKTRLEDGAEVESPWAGHWVRADGSPQLIAPNGARAPWPKKIGMYVWAAYNIFYPWSEMVMEFLECGDDQERLKAFTNTVRGLPWRDKATSVDAGQLKARKREIEYPEDFRVVFTLDVQDEWLSGLVTVWDAEERFHIVDRLEWHGDTALINGPAWGDMIAWLRSKPEYGGRGIDAMGVDTGNRKTVVFRMKKHIPVRRLYLIKGTHRNSDGSMINMRPSSVQTGTLRVRSNLYTVATWAMKTVLVKWLGDPGRSFFSDELSDAVFDELASEELVTVVKAGRKQRQWVQRKSRNEAFDCLVYAYGVINLLNPRFQVRRVRNKIGVERDKDAPKDLAEAAPKTMKRRRVRRRLTMPRPGGVW